MKRLFAMALACMLALTAPVCACAEDAETDWYTLEEGNTAITVRLPGNTKFGLDWKCEISAPEVMEQTGEEQLLGESEGVAGTPFTRVFRFTARAGQSGAVSLIFRYADADELETVRTFVLETVADETGAIALNSVFEQQPYVDWCETDGDTVTVYLSAGCEWSYEVLDPQALAPAQERMEEDGGMAVSFRLAEGAPENIELVVTCTEPESRALRMRMITLRAEKGAPLFVERVSELRMFE